MFEQTLHYTCKNMACTIYTIKVTGLKSKQTPDSYYDITKLKPQRNNIAMFKLTQQSGCRYMESMRLAHDLIYKVAWSRSSVMVNSNPRSDL